MCLPAPSPGRERGDRVGPKYAWDVAQRMNRSAAAHDQVLPASGQGAMAVALPSDVRSPSQFFRWRPRRAGRGCGSSAARDAGRHPNLPSCAKNCVDAHRRWPTRLTQKPSISDAGRRLPTPESGSQSSVPRSSSSSGVSKRAPCTTVRKRVISSSSAPGTMVSDRIPALASVPTRPRACSLVMTCSPSQ